MYKLKTNDDTFIYDQFAILDKQKQFYESIYQSREYDNNNSQESVFFKAENITPLSLDDQKLCDGPITEAECINAINGFKKDKMPGTNGFPAEFYKFFWPELRAEMLSSFHFTFQTGSLSISQRRGVISLIPKKDKDKSLLENLRLISLLIVDYKILTKIIAKRIEKVWPKIINPNQTGYVKGRFIGENIRLIQDVMFLTKNVNIPRIAIFLDFRKAFDTIEWNYLLSALRLFNFGPDIQRWIEAIYHNASSCVLNNDHASPFFQLHRGIRQGCPLSGLLFVIGIEFLARTLQNDNSIKGVNIGLKMLDFEIMDKALKIAWIKQLTEHDDAAWKIIPEFAATDYGGLSFLIECQYDVKYLSLDNLPPFYHILLKYWQEYNRDKFSKNSDIQNIIIWNNSRILIGGKPMFYKPLFQAQIISIKHLLNENNTFLLFDELKQKACISIPFTLYYGLITSIFPTEWKILLRNQNNCSPTVIPTLAPLHEPPSTRTTYSFF